MPVAWKIIATTARVGSKPPQDEYFLAAFPDQASALKALCAKRPDLNGAQFEVRGQADGWLIDWLQVEEGQILSVMVLQ